jgi:hypothetical protein
LVWQNWQVGPDVQIAQPSMEEEQDWQVAVPES